MFRLLLLGFLVFSFSLVVVPTSSYAISLDDDEEDAEDVADLLNQAKKAGKSESFDKADDLLKKAKMYGVKTDEVKEVSDYIAKKKQEKKARLERERKERERLARLKREREERARQARLARQRQSYSSSSSSSYGGGNRGSISLCIPSVPYKCCKSYECNGKSASGKYVTIRLLKDFVGNCYTLSVYGGNGYAGASTCSGANGSWSPSANGSSGYTNGLANTIAWILKRL